MDDAAGNVRDRLRALLPHAMKARDAVAVAAVRSTLAAIDNAEAIDATQSPRPVAGHPRFAGTVSGLRAAEVDRRSLSAAEMESIVRAEAAERHMAARDYERSGHHEQAERLRGEADVLGACLGDGDPPAS